MIPGMVSPAAFCLEVRHVSIIKSASNRLGTPKTERITRRHKPREVKKKIEVTQARLELATMGSQVVSATNAPLFCIGTPRSADIRMHAHYSSN